MNTYSFRNWSEVSFALVLGAVSALAAWSSHAATTPVPPPTPAQCAAAPSYPLPLPSTLNQAAYQGYDVTVYNFLACWHYMDKDYLPLAGWGVDKAVRDTGPFISGKAYGTHPNVRIFYSPQVMAWLKAGRKGAIPDGAMIIKEQYSRTPSVPAAYYEAMTPSQLVNEFTTVGRDWTVMIRDSKGSHDGWYWIEVFDGFYADATNSYQSPFAYPNGNFGEYCVNCHASAKDSYTFSALNNIKGFPGDPLTFRVDNSWRPSIFAKWPVGTGNSGTSTAPLMLGADADTAPDTNIHKQRALLGHSTRLLRTAPNANTDFLKAFDAIKPVPIGGVQMMVAQTLDHIVSGPKGPEEFLTSDQCAGCHGAISGANPIMFLPTTTPPKSGVGIDVSPWGEWRWSPMGLAGRDPVFYAQLESELAYIKTIPDQKTSKALKDTTVDTCFRCHGVMGKRQWNIDTKCDPTDPVHPCNPANPARPQFLETFPQISETSNPHFKYGALARDGVSCLSCHRQQPTQQPPGSHVNSLKYFLENSITGLFQTGPADKVIGPFDDVMTLPMKNALGIKPEHSEYIKSSRVCGTCHSIYLPVIDKAPIQPVGPKTHFNMEQATYLEWLNSSFQNEIPGPGPGTCYAANGASQVVAPCVKKSCQDCHMPGGYHNKELDVNVPQIKTQIAVIEDQTYPQADHRADTKDITVKYRESGFVRHELLGMNVFLLEMAKQFNNIMGVNPANFMSLSTTGIDQTIANFTRQAQESTATIAADVVSVDAGKLVADVKVTNLAGHRLPSGVGFRRAFIEFDVVDNSNGMSKIIWASGRTNPLGIIVDGEGKTLPSEFFTEYVGKDGKKHQHFQPHYQSIDAQDQVQIYEELTYDADGKITTSFLRRDHEFKDNRLLPTGWTKAGPDPKNFSGVYLEATYPKGGALRDPDYQNGSGTDSLRYSVALPAGTDPKNLSVRATLYYQSIPPYFLAMRFAGAPDGPGTQRLHYMTSNLNLNNSPAKDWKVKITAIEIPVAK